MDFKINKRKQFVWKGAAASGATDSPRRVQLPCGLSYCTGRGEEGKGERELQGAVSVSGLLTTVLLIPSRNCCKVLPFFFHTLNINYLRMGDLIVRIMVTLL